MASTLALFVALCALCAAQSPAATQAATTASPSNNAVTQAPLADCKLASTSVIPPAVSGLPQPAATLTSYCDCAGGIKAPVATTSSDGKILTVCAAAPSPVMASSAAQDQSNDGGWARLANLVISAAHLNVSNIDTASIESKTSLLSDATKVASSTGTNQTTTAASTESTATGGSTLTTATANQTSSASGTTAVTTGQISSTGSSTTASTTGSTSSTHAGAPAATAFGTVFALGGLGAMLAALA